METNKSFSISAKTCTLKYNSQLNGEGILSDDVKYIIPIYQRPYSWSYEQVKKFLSDIFSSYWGNEGQIVEEPMFIGTMQLSIKNANNEQDIIDGQQRLTTFLVLLKILKREFPNCVELEKIGLNWLSTRVSNGTQQEYLTAFIQGDLTSNDEALNAYSKNSFLVNEVIQEQIKDENGNSASFDIERFVKYLLSNIYFVVIETKAGLSKTLQIFNAINTTGLDLNGGDIFKIRMYEYLRDKKGKEETVFDDISLLYQMIDENNAKLGRTATDINGILSTYQYILIAKYGLPTTLYSYSTDTFFERLFDTIFNINKWEHFKNNVENIVELSIKEIERIIEVRYEWENSEYLTAEDACAIHFIWLSRYGRYWALIFVFLYKFKGEKDYWDNMRLFTKQLSKLYVIYSIRFAKAINEIHTFTYSLIKDIINKSFEEVMRTLNEKIGKLENHKGWGDFENALGGDIVDNSKVKNIICRLSAMLEETYEAIDKDSTNKISNQLFGSPIDIEHIQSYHDIDEKKRNSIWEQWGSDINSIGNLMVLESSINKSISNREYAHKITRYPESQYIICKKQVTDYSKWTVEDCRERKESEIKKILKYLFG